LRQEREHLLRKKNAPNAEPKKVPPPVMKKPLMPQRNQPIPPKPSIKADLMSRREILEMNKRPGASIQNGGKEDSPPRSILRQKNESPEREPMSREELLRMNRRSLNSASGSAWYDPPQVQQVNYCH
jgi:hypothetical protein